MVFNVAFKQGVSRKKLPGVEHVQLSAGPLSAAQVRTMSSGEIEDDSINTQI